MANILLPPPPAKARLWPLLGVGLLSAFSAGAQTITVYSSVNLPVGSTRQLTAYVPLSPNTVVWRVNGVVGGNSSIGTVSATGLYTAPAAVQVAVVVAAQLLLQEDQLLRSHAVKRALVNVPDDLGRRRA
mgnify:CR=1 FL=1